AGGVAARRGEGGPCDGGVPGGGLDHEPAGLDLSALLRLQDDLPRGTVLHRLAGVHEFGLAQDGASRRGGGALKHDQRRIADGVDDSVPSFHFVRPSAFATDRNLDDAFASDKRASVPIPKFASLCSSLVCELRNRRTLATY